MTLLYTWTLLCIICANETRHTWYHCHQMPMDSLANRVCLSKLFLTLKPVWMLNSVLWSQYTWVIISPKCLSIHYFNLWGGADGLPEFWQIIFAGNAYFIACRSSVWLCRCYQIPVPKGKGSSEIWANTIWKWNVISLLCPDTNYYQM